MEAMEGCPGGEHPVRLPRGAYGGTPYGNADSPTIIGSAEAAMPHLGPSCRVEPERRHPS